MRYFKRKRFGDKNWGTLVAMAAAMAAEVKVEAMVAVAAETDAAASSRVSFRRSYTGELQI